MNEYITLTQARNWMSLDASETSDDIEILQSIEDASRAIDRYCFRSFYPNRKTLYYDLPQDSQRLKFEEDIVEVYGLSDMGGASEIDASVYWLRNGNNWNQTPYNIIELDYSSGCVFNYSGTEQRAIVADAVTAYHEDYDNAWIFTNASLTEAINASQTNIVISISNSDEWGKASPICAQKIVKLDNEYVYVITKLNENDTHKTWTVKRGINGTTAASHAEATSASFFKAENDIMYSTKVLTDFQYKTRDAEKTGRRITPLGGGFVLDDPDSWPSQVRTKLQRYVKKRVYSI